MERMGKEGKMLSQQINEKEWILPPLNGLRHNLRLKCYFLIFFISVKNCILRTHWTRYRGKKSLLVIKARVLYLYTNTSNESKVITKWLIATKINWFNMFIDNIINKIKQYLIETNTNTTLCTQ